MKNKKQRVTGKFAWMVCMCVSLSVWVGCSSNDNDPANPDLSVNQKVNNFTYDVMNMFYLWNKEIPSSVKPDTEQKPEEYFHKMCYKRSGMNWENWTDKWSFLENTSLATRTGADETTLGFGYQLYPFTFEDAGPVYFVVLYVNPDSPASKAGLKRGDIVYKVNGRFLTKDTYYDFYDVTSAAIEVGELYTKDSRVEVRSLNEAPVSLQAEKQYFETVVHSEIISESGSKVGYICYTGYSKKSKDKLVSVLADFKKENVSELILDLRYNPGGYADVAGNLASMLAPAEAVTAQKTFLKEEWNANMMKQIKDPNQYFDKDVKVKMGLSKIYVLTSTRTASASEATMVGLEPHMEVIHIGEKTHGKFCGALTFYSSSFYKEYGKYSHDKFYGEYSKDIEGWEANVMIYRFMNADGKDPEGGLVPQYEVPEFTEYAVSLFLEPLGNEKDPMIAQALSLITGTPLRSSTRAAGVSSTIKSLPVPAMEGRMIVEPTDLPEELFYK